MGANFAYLTSVRENNLSLVLNLIREAGSISRATLSRQTQLSATTISALAAVLLESGFVRESGTGESSGGRPPILLQFDYSFRYVLGVDMGARHLIVVVMDLQGCVVAHQFRRFNVMQDPPGTIAAIVEMVGRVMDAADLEMSAILGIGIAVPAPLEGEKLDRLSSLILPAWADYDLAADVHRALNLPVYLENDANAGVVAEKWWGSGRGFANLAYIKLGTGVGSGLIVNNEIYRGAGGTAGEIGHTTIDNRGPLCRCGNRGCLEGFVGASAVVAEVARRRMKKPPADPTGDTLTIDRVIAAALAGDPISQGVIEDAGTYLGIAIANLLNLFNPGLVVLGGELVTADLLLLNAVRASVQKRAMPKAAQEANIAISRFGNDVVAIGAATLAIQHAFAPSNLSRLLKG